MVQQAEADKYYGGPRPFEQTLFNNRELQNLLEYAIDLNTCRAAHVIDEFRTAPGVFRLRNYRIDGTLVDPDQDFKPQTRTLAQQVADNFTIVGINPHMPSVALKVGETKEGSIVYAASSTRLLLWNSARDFRQLTEDEVSTYASEVQAHTTPEEIRRLSDILNQTRRVGGFVHYMGFAAPCEKPLPKATTAATGNINTQKDPFGDIKQAIDKLTQHQKLLIQIAQGKTCLEIPELKGEEITREEATKALAELFGSATAMGLQVADQMKTLAVEYGSIEDVKTSDETRKQVISAIVDLWKK